VGCFDIKSKISISNKRFNYSSSNFIKLESAPQSNIVAEAYYFRAFQLHQEQQFEQSNELIGKIAQLGSASGIWNVKALILLATNYFKLNDSFQAIFVLESVIENFETYPEEVDLAKNLLVQYKTNEKDIPNEIE